MCLSGAARQAAEEDMADVSEDDSEDEVSSESAYKNSLPPYRIDISLPHSPPFLTIYI